MSLNSANLLFHFVAIFLVFSLSLFYSTVNIQLNVGQPPFCLSPANHRRLHCSPDLRPPFDHRFFNFFPFSSFTITPSTAHSFSPAPKTASSIVLRSQVLSSPEVPRSFAPPVAQAPPGHHHHRSRDEGLTGANHYKTTSYPRHQGQKNQQQHKRARSIPLSNSKHPGVTNNPRCILRPPAARLANPVNHVPRITPVAVPHPWQLSDENLPLDANHNAYPLLSIPEQRRSRLTPSSLVVERSQGETESWRTSIAVPQGQRRSGTLLDVDYEHDHDENNYNIGTGEMAATADNLRPPEQAHLAQDSTATAPPATPRTRDLHLPRHVPSQVSLRSQSQIASIPSNPGQQPQADVAEELAWGPAHPCFPHINPHVPIESSEYTTTRIIRIRRDWMVKGDLAPTFSNLYPEILDPLLPEHEFRKIIAIVNDELIKAFDPYRLRNWIDGALGLVTGWLWEDIGAPAVKRHLQHVEAWLERWNREVGAKDGVRIWGLRRTAYMSLDIQIPDPKVGIIHSEDLSLPGTRPSTGAGREV